MAAPLRPAAAAMHGRDNWVWVPTIAAIATPLNTEVTAASAIDVTTILFDDAATPSQDTNLVTAARRYGDTVLYQYVGDSTPSGGAFHYQYDPQAAAGSTGKKFYSVIGAGINGFLVQRTGLPIAQAFAAGQFVNVYPVSFGPSFPSPAGDGETQEQGMTAQYAITGPFAIGVALT